MICWPLFLFSVSVNLVVVFIFTKSFAFQQELWKEIQKMHFYLISFSVKPHQGWQDQVRLSDVEPCNFVDRRKSHPHHWHHRHVEHSLPILCPSWRRPWQVTPFAPLYEVVEALEWRSNRLVGMNHIVWISMIRIRDSKKIRTKIQNEKKSQ